MLIWGLRDRLFVPPLVEVRPHISNEGSKNLVHARKITPEDRHISFMKMHAMDIYRRHLALGRLWVNIMVNAKRAQRMIIEDVKPHPRVGVFSKWIKKYSKEYEASSEEEDKELQKVRFAVFREEDGTNGFRLYIEDGEAIIISCPASFIRVENITLEGQSKRSARSVMSSINHDKIWRITPDTQNSTERTKRFFIEPIESEVMEERPL